MARKGETMITRGLKKGERFEDGGRTFIVEEVLENGNYISREVTKEDEPKEIKPKKKKEPEEK